MTRTQRVLSWFPRGLRISEAEWDRRHRTLVILLAAQIPLVFLFGLWQAYEVPHLLLELAVPIATALIALSPRLGRRLRAATVTAGIVFLSAALVHLSGGYIEAHFHFFIMLGFIALYQDWFPFGWAIGFVVASHGFMTVWDPDSMFNHEAAQQQPFLWAGIHGAAVAFACAGQLTAWKAAEREAEEKARIREEAAAARRDAIARLYVDLSRRNGSLVEKQLTVIDRLEREVRDTDVLGKLFELDHLTTRVRRNGESLLVVAGADPVVTRRRPMPLVDVARAAVSEVDQYARVDVAVDVDTQLHGPAVRDLAHLLAELVENGTAFSPPRSRVTIDARAAEDGHVVVTVEDRGLGMAPDALAAANDRLTDPEELTVETTRHLGHHVVARLAAKHDVAVTLRPTDGGGTTAVVTIPASLVYTPIESPSAPEAADEQPSTSWLDEPHAEVVEVADATPSATPTPAPEPTPVAETAPAAEQTPVAEAENVDAAPEPAPAAAEAADADQPDEAADAQPDDADVDEQDDPAAAGAVASILDDLPMPPWETEQPEQPGQPAPAEQAAPSASPTPPPPPPGAGSSQPAAAPPADEPVPSDDEAPVPSLSFTASGGGKRRRRRKADGDGSSLPRRRPTTPAPTAETADDAAPALPVREPAGQDGPAEEKVPATTPAFVSPPAADVAPTLPARGNAPGLPTRRPGANHAAARATGLFGSPAADGQERGEEAGGHGNSGDSSRAALRALSEYQQAQRAVRGIDTEEPR